MSTTDEYRTVARLLLSDDFSKFGGNYAAEAKWFEAAANRIEATERVDHGSVDDGMGSEWQRCKADCGIEVVRPGKAQCDCTEPTDEDEADDISGFMDALKASRAHNSAPAEPAEEETKAEELQDVEVMQWDGTRASIDAICKWVNSFDDDLDDHTMTYCFTGSDDVADVFLATLEGDVRVSDGDFIVRDLQGNFWRRDRNAYATVAAFSPVVPAPTETGPWQHRDGRICVYAPAVTPRLRYRIGKFNDHGDFVYDDSERLLPEGFAPFVAAEDAS